MISVVIPHYNGIHLLKVCLDALENQIFKEFECIVVDNASEDESIMFLNRHYPWVHIINLDRNYGFSYAVNRGIEIAKGDYIALLNNDTQVDKEWLDYLYKAIKKDEKIFSVGSKLLKYENPSLIDDAGEEYNLLGWAYQLGAGKRKEEYNKSYEVFANCGGAVLYRKVILDEIGYFDEAFFAYMEDVDIGYRALLKGYYNRYEPRAQVLHIGSATSGTKYNSFKAKLTARNNVWVAYKNMPLLQLVLNFPFLLIGFFIKYLFFLKKGLGKAYLSGIIEAVGNINKINKKKHERKMLKHYLHVQFLLIKNTFKFIIEKAK